MIVVDIMTNLNVFSYMEDYSLQPIPQKLSFDVLCSQLLFALILKWKTINMNNEYPRSWMEFNPVQKVITTAFLAFIVRYFLNLLLSQTWPIRNSMQVLRILLINYLPTTLALKFSRYLRLKDPIHLPDQKFLLSHL